MNGARARSFAYQIAAVAALSWCPALAVADPAPSFEPEAICTTALASIMGRDPKIVRVTLVAGDVLFLSYVRPIDNFVWDYRCKIQGNRVIWGSEPGRWREDPKDDKVFFEIVGDGRQLASLKTMAMVRPRRNCSSAIRFSSFVPTPSKAVELGKDDEGVVHTCRGFIFGQRLRSGQHAIPVLHSGLRLSRLEQLHLLKLPAVPGHGFGHGQRMPRQSMVQCGRRYSAGFKRKPARRRRSYCRRSAAPDLAEPHASAKIEAKLRKSLTPITAPDPTSVP
jgi:hypothetical protein